MKKLIIFFLFGIINVFFLGGCGKTDNRVVLHSEAEGDLLSIKASNDKTSPSQLQISKPRLSATITSRLDSVSEIYDISDELDERNQFWNNKWYILFTVKDTSGRVFTGFKCLAYVIRHLESPSGESTAYLSLKGCGTNDGEGAHFLDSDIRIPLDEVAVRMN